ncbi:hypothetical protein QQF64_003556 [Cirrhinus molitorella]|uniref:Immunoglobulin V-set domain-containing protein n=1 Tax=Cirrhinus molitorella TaxID=172907 RepID=A0ABR3MLN1_9TELE
MDLHINCNIKWFTLLCLALHCFLWKSSLTVSVQQGQNVTLSCPLIPNSNDGVLSWYKQTPWHGPQLILSYNITNTSQVRYGMGLDHSRYVVLTREGVEIFLSCVAKPANFGLIGLAGSQEICAEVLAVL